MTIVPRELERLFQMQKEDVQREFAPYFYDYFPSFFSSFEGLRLYSERCKYVFELTRAKNKKVLDIGCGFGLISINLASFGAHMVSGIDANEEKVDVFQKILSRFDLPPNNIEAKLGDALSLEYEDNCFDVVIAKEMISHVRDSDIFLQEIRRVLKDGGVFYISDGDNSFNILERRERRKFWKDREHGPVPAASLRGTDSPLPWLLIRREMIQSSYPHLDGKTLDLLAGETAGMYGSRILEAAEEYLNEGKVLNKPAFKFRDPVTGEYNEFEFNPYALVGELEKHGFSAKVLKPYFPESRHRGFLKNLAIIGLRAFHPLSLVIAPHFEILARKKPSG